MERDDNPVRPVGGFFELELPVAARSVLSQWTGERPAAFFANARSALSALIAETRPESVWLPAYLCHALADPVPPELRRYYPVGKRLTPDVPFLRRSVRRGDMVVGIDYFGHMPEPDFLDFARKTEDLLFVEDCAQCLAPDPVAWGAWRLFSPRKLMGVADGGILVAMRDGLPLPRPTLEAKGAAEAWLPQLLRFEDENAHRRQIWHNANQKKESLITVSDHPMTRFSIRLLAALDIDEMIERRARNFGALAQALTPYMSPMAGHLTAAPFALLLRVGKDRRDTVLNGLQAESIFAPVHWRNPPSPREDFPEEHDLSEELISLPCDHRYGKEEMHRIAGVVQRLMV